MTFFDCKKMHPKCHADCCGIVPIPKEIYESHKNKIVNIPVKIDELGHAIVAHTLDQKCIFLNLDLSCNIYDDRPDICKKYGDETHPMLCCPVLDKNGKERSRQNRRKIERQTEKFINKLRILC